MSPALVKAVMKAIKSNNIARIKALAQRQRMSPGRLLSQAKKAKRKSKQTLKRERVGRARAGQS